MNFKLPQTVADTGEPWTFARTARVIRTASRLASSIPSQIEIFRFLKYPVFANFLRVNLRFALKFAADNYLVRDLTLRERKICFLYHYQRLKEALPDDMLRGILHGRVPIVEMKEDGCQYRVTGHLSRPWDKEGELSLTLDAEGTDLYVISFSIVPGSIVKSEAPDVLLVTRMQGTRGEFRAIQNATKALHDVAPASLLMAALQGFGEALGVNEIVGISAERQSAYNELYKDIFVRSYDEFFHDVGLSRDLDDLYRSPIPTPEKPMQDVKHGHKLRTKEKRAFKRKISDAVRRFFEQNWRGDGDYSHLDQIIEVSARPERSLSPSLTLHESTKR